MNNIRQQFNKIQEKNPLYSSYICFSMTVRGSDGKYNKSTINRWFNKLVDIGDYIQSEKRAIIRYLVK